MADEPTWLRLSDALSRLTPSEVGNTEAKAALCEAIVDRKITVRVTTERTDTGRADALDPIERALRGQPFGGGEVFKGNDVVVPIHLTTSDFDWAKSRPLAPWGVRPRSVHERYDGTFDPGPWRIALLELHREDVDRLRRIRPAVLAPPSEFRTWDELDRERSREAGDPRGTLLARLVSDFWLGKFETKSGSKVFQPLLADQPASPDGSTEDGTKVLEDGPGDEAPPALHEHQVFRHSVAQLLAGKPDLVSWDWDGTDEGLATFAAIPFDQWPEKMRKRYGGWAMRPADFEAWRGVARAVTARGGTSLLSACDTKIRRRSAPQKDAALRALAALYPDRSPLGTDKAVAKLVNRWLRENEPSPVTVSEDSVNRARKEYTPQQPQSR